MMRIGPTYARRLDNGGSLAKGGALANSGLSRPAKAGIALLLLLAPLAVSGAWASAHRPTTLAAWHLTGPRSPACIRLITAPDMSGSMITLAAARDAALQQVLTWAPKNLRADDEIAVIEWASNAHVAMQPTTISDLAGTTAGHADVGGHTEFVPVLKAVNALPKTNCVSVLVVLSDGLLSSTPSNADSLLRQATVTSVTLVQPDRKPVSRAWKEAFPFAPSVYAPATDSNANAYTIGQVLADATGQELTKR